jgi:hypothetical protein
MAKLHLKLRSWLHVEIATVCAIAGLMYLPRAGAQDGAQAAAHTPVQAGRIKSSGITTSVLPILKLDPSRVTVSGFSSGGFMAVQLHIAHSKIFHGAASIAGGIYECTKGQSGRSRFTCMYDPQNIAIQEHIDLVQERAKKNQIDDPGNLSDDRVAIFVSQSDVVSKPVGSEKLSEFYQAFLPKSSITRISHPHAAHGFPTLNFGKACETMGRPWMLNCQLDLAGQVLAAIDPQRRSLSARGHQNVSNFVFFDQTKIVGPGAYMYPWGALYVPSECRQSRIACGIHVALHGCQMNPDFIQKKFIENAGYNEWAETNRLIILYPQSAKGAGNPYGCWDWVGFTGPDYTQRAGSQIKAIRTILSELGLR